MKYIKSKPVEELLNKAGANKKDLPDLLGEIDDLLAEILEDGPFIEEVIYQFEEEKANES